MKMAGKRSILVVLFLAIICAVAGNSARSSFNNNPLERHSNFQSESKPLSRKFKLGFPYFPKFIFGLEPNPIHVKISKTFHPFVSTNLKVSADYNVGQSTLELKSSWEDVVVGAKLELSEKELQVEKQWQISFGPVEELVMRLRARGAFDFQTKRAYAKLGFRTDLSPLSSIEGLTLYKRLPLDGIDGNTKVEIKAHVTAPKIHVEYSTDKQYYDNDDIEVNVEQANLLLEF